MSFNSCVRSLSTAGIGVEAVLFGGVTAVADFEGVDLDLSTVLGELALGAGGGLGGGCAEVPGCTAGAANGGAFTMAVGNEGGAGGAGGTGGSGAISMSEIESCIGSFCI